MFTNKIDKIFSCRAFNFVFVFLKEDASYNKVTNLHNERHLYFFYYK